jgi:hypothetical protein
VALGLQLVLWTLLGGFYFAWNNRPNYHFTAPIWPLVLLQLGFAVLLFNYLVYWLIPHWLLRGRPWAAVGGGLAVVVAYRLWNYAGSRLTTTYLPTGSDLRAHLAWAYGQPLGQSLLSWTALTTTFYDLVATMMLPIVISFLAFALVIDRQRMALERDHLRLEISAFKAQLNPDFLFRTLDSLHRLCLARAPSAGDVVLQIADLMHYTLYETEADWVPLGRELEFLESYLALTQLHSAATATLAYELSDPASRQPLPPLLLLPFVERLFVGPENVAGLVVAGTAHVEAGQLTLALLRTTGPGQFPAYADDSAVQGALRRLHRHYPGRHLVQVHEAPGTLRVTLQLSL